MNGFEIEINPLFYLALTFVNGEGKFKTNKIGSLPRAGVRINIYRWHIYMMLGAKATNDDTWYHLY
jgi:hypothetical protein